MLASMGRDVRKERLRRPGRNMHQQTVVEHQCNNPLCNHVMELITIKKQSTKLVNMANQLLS